MSLSYKEKKEKEKRKKEPIKIITLEKYFYFASLYLQVSLKVCIFWT